MLHKLLYLYFFNTSIIRGRGIQTVDVFFTERYVDVFFTERYQLNDKDLGYSPFVMTSRHIQTIIKK